jgi:putative nucleotidyltransferase with HDIG domain
VPVIALAAMFGPLGPLAGEAAIALTRAIRREDPPVRYLWDFGALSLAGAGAAAVFNALPATGADSIAVGATAGLAYYAINIPLLAVVITLSRGGSPIGNFREQLAWLLPHYLAFGAFAGLFVLVHERMGWNAFLIFGLPTGLLWIAEQQYLERSRASVEELRRRHNELEDANVRLRRLLTDNQALLGRLQQSYLSTITSLARTIEAKDPYTGGHTERVSRVAATLAIELGFSAEDLRAVEVGAVIHDIGKIGVPDATLLKAGPLTDEERLDIQRHPEISSYILAELDVPAIVKQMVRSHHERYDGRGYPDNLAGEEIPLSARILTVADALDAMTSNRPYRPAMPLNDALAVIEENSETQFCPIVVAALRRCLERDAEFAFDDSADVLARAGMLS